MLAIGFLVAVLGSLTVITLRRLYSRLGKVEEHLELIAPLEALRHEFGASYTPKGTK